MTRLLPFFPLLLAIARRDNRPLFRSAPRRCDNVICRTVPSDVSTDVPNCLTTGGPEAPDPGRAVCERPSVVSREGQCPSARAHTPGGTGGFALSCLLA